MGVVGEFCTSPLCSSSFFVFFFLPILRLFITFFNVHTFDDAWYVEIAHLSHPQAVFMNPPTI